MVVIEMAALAAYRHFVRAGVAQAENVAFLGAGFWMLIALRVVVGGGPFELFAIAMLLSLVLHVVHLRQRWLARMPRDERSRRGQTASADSAG